MKYLNDLYLSMRYLYLNVNSFNDLGFEFPITKYRSATIINQYNFHEQAFSGQESVRTFSFHFEIRSRGVYLHPYLLCSDISIKDAEIRIDLTLQMVRKIT